MKQIQIKQINELKPYPNNPRINKDAIPAVAESIKEFGFNSPIIVDKENVIVCGHTRYEAAKSLGMDEVPVLVLDNLTDDQIKAYRLADNQSAALSGWDVPLLDLELSELDELGWDMGNFGFTDYTQYSVPDKLGKDDAPAGEIIDVPIEERRIRYVMVSVEDDDDAAELIARMEEEGRTCKPIE